MTKDQEFLEYIVKAIVENKDDVHIDRKIDEMGVLLTLKVNQEDIPRVIGKEGKTAKALKHLLQIVGYTNKTRANLKIDAPMITDRKKQE